MNIAFVGLGVMGAPMCANLIRTEAYRLRVFDIDASRMDPLVSMGAGRACSVATAVSGADLVLTSLPGPQQVESVAFGEGGIFNSIEPGATWIDLSTNNLDVGRALHEKAHGVGVELLDAPVSGGDEGAIAGTLTILVGGREEVYARWLPLLRTLGEKVLLLGGHGAGYAAKIAQVVLCYLHSLALSEALMLGIRGGVGAREMLGIIRESTGRSYVADRYGPSILNGDYDPSFTIGLAHKDMGLAMDMASKLGIELPMCRLTESTYSRAVGEYGFDSNHLKAVRLLEEDNGVFLQEEKV
ncbi:MAG: NAD(P)-dependent oxidoreductase [Gammaproteobacteria bacterium]|nr:NAD(P)-dependent oxidoreductase [Gammaproteobacteria bacterium]MYD76154.1 NAD(P)-dependent oxidoreductase [Gammaproteobacteria bacterium]MYJ51699.1 NAD(P)-dependent oxidoreductase [Gammaproteobacteria bacterium]